MGYLRPPAYTLYRYTGQFQQMTDRGAHNRVSIAQSNAGEQSTVEGGHSAPYTCTSAYILRAYRATAFHV